MARRGEGPRLRYRRNAWVIRWTEGGQTRERRTGARSREEAEALFAEWLAEQRRKPRGRRLSAEYLIADCLSEYLEEHGPETQDPARIAFAMERLLDWWDDATVDAINKASCQAYAAARREEGVKDGTIRRELSVLSAALGHAYDSERLPERPKVWMPEPGPGRDRWLTRSEAARLLWAAKSEPKVRPYLPLFILMGLYTAGRKEAILSLRWSQVDLERGIIHFAKPGRKRTNKGRATIPIPRRLMTFLRIARRRGSDLGPVIHIDGKPIGNIKKSFQNAAVRAGLVTPMLDKDGEPRLDKDGNPRLKHDVTPHTLRHTSATWMAQSGVDLWEIAGYLGQTVAATTEKYAHHHPDYMQEARAALDRHSVTNSVTK